MCWHDDTGNLNYFHGNMNKRQVTGYIVRCDFASFFIANEMTRFIVGMNRKRSSNCFQYQRT